MSQVTVAKLSGIATTLDQIDITAGHQLLINGSLKLNSTGSHTIPSGTTAQRPASPANGYLRYNTTTAGFEVYNAGSWSSVGTSSGGAIGTYTSPALSGIQLKSNDYPSGYYWIQPVGYTSPRYVYVDNTNYDGGWCLVMAVGANSTNHWDTFESSNLYSATVDGVATNYVPYFGTGYSTTSGRRWDDNFIRDLASNENGGEETFNLRMSRNGANPPGGAYDTYAGGTTTDWRYAAFTRFNGGIYYFSSLNTGADGRQGDRHEGCFSVSHSYPYNWEQPGGWEHMRVYDGNYKVFDFHSNPSSLQTSRYGVNRFLWGYTGANSGQGIYGGSDSFTGSNNTNPGYMFVR